MGGIKFESINNVSLNNGIYTIPDIAKILNLPYQKVRHWVNCYWDGRLGKEFKKTYSWSIDRSKAVNFHTLIEFYILIQLGEMGISTHAVLQAHKELSVFFKTMYPFADRRVLEKMTTDKKKLMIEQDEKLISLDGTRQINLDFMRTFFKHIEFGEDHLVSKFWPRGKENSICVDPRRQFGHPVVDNTNIFPETLCNLYKGGEKIDFIASLYELDTRLVKDAIHYCNAS